MNKRTINKLDNNSFEINSVLIDSNKKNRIILQHEIFTGINKDNFIITDLLKANDKILSNKNIYEIYGVDVNIILNRKI
jgi:hypothetical protein